MTENANSVFFFIRTGENMSEILRGKKHIFVEERKNSLDLTDL